MISSKKKKLTYLTFVFLSISFAFLIFLEFFSREISGRPAAFDNGSFDQIFPEIGFNMRIEELEEKTESSTVDTEQNSEQKGVKRTYLYVKDDLV